MRYAMEKCYNHFITVLIGGEIKMSTRSFPNQKHLKKSDYEEINRYVEIERKRNPRLAVYPIEVKELDLDELIEM